MDDETRELLTASLRKVVTAPRGGIRAALADLGWDEVVADDPAAATTLLFTEHGRALADSTVLDDVVLAALAPALPRSDAARAVAYPHPADADRPSSTPGAVRGVLLGPPSEAAEIVVPVRADDGATALLVIPAGAVSAEPLPGFDRTTGWHAVSAGPAAAAAGTTVAAEGAAAGAAWTSAVAAGRRALAAEISGTAQGALAFAVEHTRLREQFARPIATFQAVRHRLAEAHVAVTALASVLEVAHADGGAWAAALAKLEAGRTQALVMRHAVQVCGAMGLSAEADLHRYVVRAAALDGLLGGHQLLAESIGRDLLGGHALERLAEL